MEDKINFILSEESAKLNISLQECRKLAERGCQIAFKDSLSDRITLLGGIENLSDDDLRIFLLVCLQGGSIEAFL